MLSFDAAVPALLPSSIVERFFIARGELPKGVILEDKTIPSIMQSVIIDFGGTTQTAKLPNGNLFFVFFFISILEADTLR